jgi:hypothetical protein
MTKLNLTVITDSSMIRNLCIREHWYTDGTIAAYNNLLTYVDDHRILDEESLDFIAWDIYNHSTNFDYSYTGEENTENMKYIILNDACRISHTEYDPRS